MARNTLTALACLLGTAPFALGINALLRPDSALAMLEFPPPSTATDRLVAENLIYLYGARDVFMGLAIYASAAFGSRRTLGWLMVAGGAVVTVDGAIVRNVVGSGEWAHWPGVPLLVGVGIGLLRSS